MTLNEILTRRDEMHLVKKFFKTSSRFENVTVDPYQIGFYSVKGGYGGSLMFASNFSMHLFIQGSKGDIDMGRMEDLEEIVDIIDDIDKDPAAWFKEYDPDLQEE